MPIHHFVYTRPIESKDELATCRETLINWIDGHIPPDAQEVAGVVLPLSVVKRFMLDARRLDQVERELSTGLHEQVQEQIERTLTLKQEIDEAKILIEEVQTAPLFHESPTNVKLRVQDLSDWAATAGLSLDSPT